MYSTLTTILTEAADENSSIKGVIITGNHTSRGFCSGSDTKELYNKKTMNNPTNTFIETIISYRKPVLAIVFGLCVGLGFSLLPHCDVVFAVADETTFSMPVIRMANIAPGFCSTYLFPHIFGTQTSTEIFWGKTITSQQLANIGFLKIIPSITSITSIQNIENLIQPFFNHFNTTRDAIQWKTQIQRPIHVVEKLIKIHQQEMLLQYSSTL
jgi:enoyl-CoA hydratase/carnithine racemase